MPEEIPFPPNGAPAGVFLTLGQHGARINSVEQAVEKMDGKLDELLKWANQSKGSARMILAVVGGVAGLTATGVEIAHLLLTHQ